MRAISLSVHRRITVYAALALMALALAVFLVSVPAAYADHEDAHDGPTEATPVPVPDDIADPIDTDSIDDWLGGL